MEEFEVDDLFDGLPGPDYNVAPTVAVPAVFERRVKDTGELARTTMALAGAGISARSADGSLRWCGGWSRPGPKTLRSARG